MADQILSPFLEYIVFPVGRQFSYLFKYNGNLEEFRSKRRRLEMAADDVKLRVLAAESSGEAIFPGVKDWLNTVNEVFDESQRFVEEEVAVSKWFFNGPMNLKERYQRSRKAKRKAEEFDSFKEEGRFVEGVAAAAPAPAPPQIRFMNNKTEIEFESRRSIFNEILDAIKDDGFEMIGIWGMPGIGKTSLVKRVAKYAQDEGLFKVVAMAVVSQSPSFKAIQDEIADAIGLKFTSESIQGRANELHQRLLAGKKILVILDDIWDNIELNDIGIPSGSQHKGCKVILTSRIEDVCKQMRTGKNFKIDIVSEIEALGLFLQMTGVEDRSSKKGQLAEELSKECGGLPLCIVIVARDLLNKEPNDWTDMLNRLRNSDLNTKVRAAIELSYNKMERQEEKMFFLLCALFPEDYEIPVQVLFEYGIGLNLFEKVNNVDQALVRARKLASRLKSSCLLLDARREEYVKMHDVIRDAALAIASEGKAPFLVRSEAQWRESPEKTAISLWHDDVNELPDALECPQLQILTLNRRYLERHLPDNFFTGMKNLMVLDMNGMKCVRLPQSFAGLVNLQTLRLCFCKLGDISTIGKLQNLVSLSFYGSNIKVLPKEVGELRKLTLLNLWSCRRLKVITPGVIQNLSQLEVLCMEMWGYAEEDSSPKNSILSELIHLSRLRILQIYVRDASMLPDKVLFGTLTKFRVSIGVGFDDFDDDVFSLNWQILSLRSLSENDLTKAGIKMLMKKAQHLKLEHISSIYIALPSHLWQFDAKSVALGNLTFLSVKSCHKLEYVFEHNSAKSFLKLKELVVRNCINLKAICQSKEQDNNVINFPQLSHLKLSELKNLTSFGSKFTSESALFGEQVIFRALEELDIYNLEKLEKIWHIHTLVESFFQLKVLKLTQCPQLLVVFPPSSASALRNLEEICIENCDKLETLFPSDDVLLTVDDEMIIFPLLLTLKLVNLPKFTTILRTTSQNISPTTLTFFPKLMKLQLVGIGRLEVMEEFMIKDNNGKTLPRVVATLPKLRILQLAFIHEPIELSDGLYRCGGFQSLTTLNFYSCSVLKSLLTPSVVSCLVQLQELFVNNCKIMESIVGESGKQNFDKVIEFPKLHTLSLRDLPHLTSFYNGECALKFPCLGDISIEFCSQLRTFTSITRETPTPWSQNFVSEALFGQQVSFGELRQLKLQGLELIEEIWHGDHPATTVGELSFLNVDWCDRLLKIFPSNLLAGLLNLEELEIRSCASLEYVVAVKDHPPFLSNLQELDLNNLPKLKQLWWNENICESFGLPSLRLFSMYNCPALQYVFDASVANHVENLRSLHVVNCSSIVEIVEEKPGGKTVFPVLGNLRLENLPCFKVNQSVEFPHVEDVEVYRCFNMGKRYHRVNARHVRNIQSQESMSFFESLVEYLKTEYNSRRRFCRR